LTTKKSWKKCETEKLRRTEKKDARASKTLTKGGGMLNNAKDTPWKLDIPKAEEKSQSDPRSCREKTTPTTEGETKHAPAGTR